MARGEGTTGPELEQVSLRNKLGVSHLLHMAFLTDREVEQSLWPYGRSILSRASALRARRLADKHGERLQRCERDELEFHHAGHA